MTAHPSHFPFPHLFQRSDVITIRFERTPEELAVIQAAVAEALERIMALVELPGDRKPADLQNPPG